jgi:formylglycine-generating enzyme required for sulfatase activity
VEPKPLPQQSGQSRSFWARLFSSQPSGDRSKSGEKIDGQNWVVPAVGAEIIWVSPGTFQMGEQNGYTSERPVHSVQIARGFHLGRYEVTQDEYKAIMGVNPSFYRGPRNPVEMVTWDNAMEFCSMLTARERTSGRVPEGRVYRLPTEAEWEYAARGGAATRGFTYSGSADAYEVAWCRLNSNNTPHAVGQKSPNELGLYDMSGNVAEWCFDRFDAAFYSRSPGVDPVNTQGGQSRVVRGGGWSDERGHTRSACRGALEPYRAERNLGFRICLGTEIET